MKAIWKFTLKADTPTQLLEMPVEALDILHLGVQDEKPVLWAIVDTDSKKKVNVRLDTFPTGIELPDGKDNIVRHYLGTYQIKDPYFVGHVFICESP